MVPVVVGDEGQADWQKHRARVHEALQPADYIEQPLVDRVACALWRLNRLIWFELAAIDDTKSLQVLNRSTERLRYLLPSACLVPASEHVDKIVRSEAHLGRQFYQALHELEARQTVRRGGAAPLARVEVHGGA